MKNLVLSLFVLLGVAGMAVAGVKAPAKTDKLMEKGKAGYALNCAGCHGAKGDGNGPVGKLLNPKPRDFAKSKFKNGDKVEELYSTITDGLEGTSMVAFKHLSDEDRWGIAYHVKTLEGPGKGSKKKK